MARITLKFQRIELMYDIRNTAYTMSDVMSDEDEHGKHQLADIGEDGNKDKVTRIMDLEMSRCRENIYAYTKTEVKDGAMLDDVLRETDTYVMELNVPENFSQTSALFLENLIHNYIVYRVLYEWLCLTDVYDHDKRKDKIKDKAGDLMDEIHRSLFTRMSTARRPMSPF